MKNDMRDSSSKATLSLDLLTLPGLDFGGEKPKSNHGKYSPGSQIEDKKEIEALLKQASTQRAQWQIDLYYNKKRYSFLCHDMSLNKGYVVLLYENESDRIPLKEGMKVTVYFQIKELGQILFYAFTSPIKRVFREKAPDWCIDFDFPEALECRQRRSTLRAEPKAESIKRIMLWQLPEVRNNISPPAGTWGKPMLAFLPGKIKQVAIKDISATGIRLRIPYNMVYSNSKEFATSTHYVLLLTIAASEGEEENFLLIIRIQNQKISDDMRNFDFGAQYVAISPLPADSAHEVHWRVLTGEAMVEKIAKWITSLSLEELRKVKALR